LLYVGKGTHDDQIPLGVYLIKEIAKWIYGADRNITTDNWFNSVPLTLSTLHDHKLITVRNLRRNKQEIPTEKMDVKGKLVDTFSFRQDDNDVNLYKGEWSCTSTAHYASRKGIWYPVPEIEKVKFYYKS
jgi:hypothetical protein